MFSFDGNGGGIVDLRTTLQCVQGNNPRSISLMIQTSASSGGILSTGTTNNQGAFMIAFAFCGISSIQIIIWSGNYCPTSGKRINDGLWHSVLVNYDGTTINIYVDGILDNTATNWNVGPLTSSSIASTLKTVGNMNYLGQLNNISFRWMGSLKNVVFYDYVVAYSEGKSKTIYL